MKNERAYEIAEELKNAQEWNEELCEELCELANMSEEWENADGETFESIIYAAAEKLGVEI